VTLDLTRRLALLGLALTPLIVVARYVSAAVPVALTLTALLPAGLLWYRVCRHGAQVLTAVAAVVTSRVRVALPAMLVLVDLAALLSAPVLSDRAWPGAAYPLIGLPALLSWLLALAAHKRALVDAGLDRYHPEPGGGYGFGF
jgi:hypothetical protein